MNLLISFETLLSKLEKNWALLIPAAIITFWVRGSFDAVYFDRYGLLIFIFLTGLGLWELSGKKETPNWVSLLLVLIGLMGLIVDGITMLGVK